MDKRQLGDLEASAIGLGCMGLSADYGDPVDTAQRNSLIRGAHDQGITFFDTAEAYGPFTNETLVGEAMRPIRDQIVVATKFAFGYDGAICTGLNSRPDNILQAADVTLTSDEVAEIDARSAELVVGGAGAVGTRPTANRHRAAEPLPLPTAQPLKSRSADD